MAADLRLQESWKAVDSPYYWINKYSGPWSICAVRVNGSITYELWRDGKMIMRSSDPQALRDRAAGSQ